MDNTNTLNMSHLKSGKNGNYLTLMSLSGLEINMDEKIVGDFWFMLGSIQSSSFRQPENTLKKRKDFLVKSKGTIAQGIKENCNNTIDIMRYLMKYLIFKNSYPKIMIPDIMCLEGISWRHSVICQQ